MEDAKKLQMLRTFYAGALADSVLRFDRNGILDAVTAEKRREQLLSGKARAAQLGITDAQSVFEVLSGIFGCADWRTEATESGFTATASRCMLCAFAKKMGTQSPCGIYCLDPMEGMVKGLEEGAEYKVESTLWADGACRVSVRTKGE
jgi:hypothetical protein